MIVEFINQYGYDLLYAIVVAIGGFNSLCLKNLLTRLLNDKTKRDVAKKAVRYVEQVCKELHGDDKLNEALKATSQLLAEKGISITDLELRVLVEAAVNEMNKGLEEKE